MLKWLVTYGPAFRIVFDMITISVVAVGTVRGLSIIRVIFNAAHTAAKMEQDRERIVELTRERDDLAASLRAQSLAIDGWKAAIESLGDRMEELRADMTAQITDLKHKLSLSIKFNCDLLLYLKAADWEAVTPEIPDELKADLEEYMSQKNGKG